MNRFFKLSLSAIFTVFLVYAALWIVGATFAKNEIIKELENLKAKDLSIAYEGSISTGGFPTKIQFTLSKPKISYVKNIKADITSDKLIISSNLSFSKLNLSLGDNTVTETPKTIIVYDEKNAPSVNLAFNKSIIMNLQNIVENISSATYNDLGYTVFDRDSDKEIIVFDHTNLAINREVKGAKVNNNLAIESSFADSEENSELVDLVANLSVLASANQDKPDVFGIKIDKILLKSDKSALNLDGSFDKIDDNHNLSGSINVSLDNYVNFLDFLAKNKLIEDILTKIKDNF